VGAQENGFCFQPGLPYFLMFVVTSHLLAIGVCFLSIVSVSGKFLLSVAGTCLLIAVTRLLGAVCGSFWFVVVSCQLLGIDC
jgi:hypothetical protein